jgi:hypothetical protein
MVRGRAHAAIVRRAEALRGRAGSHVRASERRASTRMLFEPSSALEREARPDAVAIGEALDTIENKL